MLNAVFITFYANADFEAVWEDGGPHDAYGKFSHVQIAKLQIERLESYK